MTGWTEGIEGLRERAQGMHEAREAVLVRTRKLGQLAARSIRHVHRLQFAEAEALLAESRAEADAARALLVGQTEMNPSYLHDTEKEMVEAALVIAIVLDRPLPTADELRTATMTYLNGAGEAASEVRRFALDAMRRGDVATAERILDAMETIYEDLITFDYADSLTHGLRRTCDALRAVVERTRSDLTQTATQTLVSAELARVAKLLEAR